MIDLGAYGVWLSALGLLDTPTARETVRAVEDLGYGAVWVGEAAGKEALTHAAFLLAATDRLPVATGIANIWARDAQAMRNGARTLEVGWPGRFVLGIGASHAPLVDNRGASYGKPLTAMREYLDAMERAPWRGPALDREPPLVLATLGPKMLDLARDRADGAHSYLVPPEHTRRARERLGSDTFLAPEQAFVLAGSRVEARRSGDRHLRGYLQLPNYRNNLERLGFGDGDLGDPPSDRLFDALIAWGDAAAIAERMREHVDAGADHVAVHPLLPSPDEPLVPPLRELASHLLEDG